MLNHQGFLKACRRLKGQEARLVGFAINEHSDEYRLVYHFDQGGELVTLETSTVDRAVPSLVTYFSTSDFAERQAFRDYRIKFFGNPNLTPPE
ncbi:MAG: NADH-quinone oxidoreductase subunit C [Candidatus Eremiobacteraeota bacterium]|nr:NADH-quinone oxidoreductase subunit C [Candidatus Eremiobacteraeota bacterium]